MSNHNRLWFLLPAILLVSITLVGVHVVTAAGGIHISGTSGAVIDSDAASPEYYLRYVGDPAPAGYSHNYQWGQPSIVCNPEDGPITFTGTIDPSAMVANQVSMIGLLDKQALSQGVSDFQGGAYAYVYYNGTTSKLNIGPSDGNAGGEIVQTFVGLDYQTDPIPLTLTIDGTADPATCASGPLGADATGCISVTVGGNTYTDSYGDVNGYDHAEFEFGAHPGWDDYLGSTLGYDFTLTGCEDTQGPVVSSVVVAPELVEVGGDITVTANVDDTATGESLIAGAEYNVDGGGWLPMSADDGAFDEISEDVTVTYTAPALGVYDPYTVCVRGSDDAGNTGAEECASVTLDVYDCFPLTLTHTGEGADPVASPANSAVCPAGEYVPGEIITLTAAPAAGWEVASWSGTDDDASTGTSNAVTMPASAHEASVAYQSADTFADVPVPGKEWMEPWIELFYDAGITTGCAANPLQFCPEREVTRAEMAVFMLRALNYPNLPYTPPDQAGTFVDVPFAGKEWMEDWIEEFYDLGITTGCADDPLEYCPERETTRAEMAVFILRALYGESYEPPAASGTFADVPVAGKEWMEPWVEQFYDEGITTGCGIDESAGKLLYCPERPVTRAEVAVFILRAFEDIPSPET